GVKASFEGTSILLGNRRLMQENGIQTSSVEERMHALEGDGKTAMLVALDGKLSGIVAVADTLKENAPAAVSKLRSMGVEVVMLTGDNRRTADAIAKKLGITKVLAEVLPQDKAKVVSELKGEGKVVAMVG